MMMMMMTKNEITCNKCANSCIPELAKQDNGKDNYGLIEAYFDSGYNSIPEFGDMVRFTFSLCESCLKNLFETFAIKPNQQQMMLLQQWKDDSKKDFTDLLVPETKENYQKHLEFTKEMLKLRFKSTKSCTYRAKLDP